MLQISISVISSVLIAYTMASLIFSPILVMAQHEQSTGIIKHVGLEQIPADDLRGLVQKQIDNKEDIISNKQDINVSRYSHLQTRESPEKNTIITQLNIGQQNGNNTLESDPQLNELMLLIDEAKSKCWQITGFTSVDPYVFVLLEAFTC